MADPISCEGWDTGKPFLGVPSKFVVINEDGEEVGTLAELIPLLMLVSNNLSDVENAVEARNNLGVYSKLESDGRFGSLSEENQWNANQSIDGDLSISNDLNVSEDIHTKNIHVSSEFVLSGSISGLKLFTFATFNYSLGSRLPNVTYTVASEFRWVHIQIDGNYSITMTVNGSQFKAWGSISMLLQKGDEYSVNYGSRTLLNWMEKE